MHGALVAVSGVAEVGLGALVLFRRWRVVAGWVDRAVRGGVPANLHMALNPAVQPFSLLGCGCAAIAGRHRLGVLVHQPTAR
jgi:uncharacterized membrane protein